MSESPVHIKKTRGCFWRLVLLLGALAMALPLILAIGVSFWGSVARSNVEKQFTAIRDEGRPATADEVAAYHERTLEKPDITKDWQAAIAPFNTDEMQDAIQNVSIVGFNASEKIANDLAFPLPDSAWPDQEKAQAFIDQHRAILDELYRVAELKGGTVFPVDFENPLQSDSEHIEPLRAAVRLLGLEARFAARTGDTARFTQSIQAILRAGETLDHESCLAYLLVRLSIEDAAAKVVHDASGSDLFPTDEAKASARRLIQLFADRRYFEQLQRTINSERACMTVYFLDPSRMDTENKENAANQSPRYPFKYQDLGYYISVMERMAAAAGQPPHDALVTAQAIHDEVDRSINSESNYRMSRRMSCVTMPAVLPIFKSVARAESRSSATAIAIAIELCRAEKGELPDDLEALVPDYLTAIPEDPFVGGPMNYLKTADGFCVYSVGEDGVDNQGEMETDGFAPDVSLQWPRRLPADVPVNEQPSNDAPETEAQLNNQEKDKAPETLN